MINPADRKTLSLNLDEPKPEKRGRGRPATGQALSNAERQKNYRERLKAQRNEKTDHCKNCDDLRKQVQELIEQRNQLIRECTTLKKQLAQHNENEEKPIKTTCWKIQKRGKGKWRTQAGSYASEAEAIEKLMDMDPCEGVTWRTIEMK